MRRLTSFRHFATLVAGACAVSAMTVAAPAPASAFSSANGVRLNSVEARLTALINKARTSRGIGALTVTSGTTDLARDWAMNQASKNLLYHNPNLVSGIESHGSADWHAAAENVGRGWDPDSLFQAYMNSPGHRANILDPSLHYLGIGWVERPDGSGYNTQVFVDRYSATYGHARRPAVGGLADTRTPSANFAVAQFESGWDPRVMLVRSGAGWLTSGPYFASPASGDQSVRFAVRETSDSDGGSAEFRVRDALDLRNATGIRVKVSAVSASGRPVTVQVNARRELGSAVNLGSVVVPSGGTFVTVTLPLPPGAKNFRNAIGVSVSRSAIESLSSALSNRQVSVRVADITVIV
jgi:uncharacterized protein YkwD